MKLTDLPQVCSGGSDAIEYGRDPAPICAGLGDVCSPTFQALLFSPGSRFEYAPFSRAHWVTGISRVLWRSSGGIVQHALRRHSSFDSHHVPSGLDSYLELNCFALLYAPPIDFSLLKHLKGGLWECNGSQGSKPRLCLSLCLKFINVVVVVWTTSPLAKTGRKRLVTTLDNSRTRSRDRYFTQHFWENVLWTW